MAESFDLYLGQTLDLPKRFSKGNTLTITSPTADISTVQNSRLLTEPKDANPCDQTHFTLFNNAGDLMFRLHIRRQENGIIINSRKKDGDWAPFGPGSSRIDYPDIRRAFGPGYELRPTTIKLINNVSSIDIFVNENFVGTYKMDIPGDAEKIEYEVLSGFPSVLHSDVQVTVE